jgi:NitT/TauT family transport system permease protein
MPTRKTEVRKLLGTTVSFVLLAAVIALFFAFRQRAGALHAPPFEVSIARLPYYAFCSFSRMLAAYVLALIFSIVYGLYAARSRAYERVMIPAIDIAQSVPVVGFFPAAVYFFVSIGHGRRIGVEMAAVFLIFTSQAWNMALGVFEAVRTIPADSIELLESFGVSGWLKFRRLLLPASVPKLVYNSILSWVAGWYFLIACEIITAGPANYRLPGLGSLLMEAADNGQWSDVVGGLLTLLAIIVAMDLFVWQPLSIWAEKFRYEFAASADPVRSLSRLDVFTGIAPAVTRAVRALLRRPVAFVVRLAESLPKPDPRTRPTLRRLGTVAQTVVLAGILGLFGYGIIAGLVALVHTLLQPWPAEVRRIPAATAASTLRMLIAYTLSLAWTLPCALIASDSPRFSRWLAPTAEIAGSMPATALFPLIVLFVIKVTGGMNLASILLILTGMQWYLLFNLMGGVSQIPSDLREAARSFGLSRFATWKRVVIPALLPSLVTGSITAWGGGWNALIVSEYFVYRHHEYQVLGLGALLDEATYNTGNGVMILLSLLAMIAVVITLNRLFWRRIYDVVTERYKLDY